MTQEQVQGLTQAEQGLEFVFSLFFVSTQNTEQVELSAHWCFLLLATSPGFNSLFFFTEQALGGNSFALLPV